MKVYSNTPSRTPQRPVCESCSPTQPLLPTVKSPWKAGVIGNLGFEKPVAQPVLCSISIVAVPFGLRKPGTLSAISREKRSECWRCPVVSRIRKCLPATLSPFCPRQWWSVWCGIPKEPQAKSACRSRCTGEWWTRGSQNLKVPLSPFTWRLSWLRWWTRVWWPSWHSQNCCS